MSDNSRLERIERQNEEILSLLQRLLNPAQSLSAKEKAAAVLAAERSGDDHRVKDVLKQINGQR